MKRRGVPSASVCQSSGSLAQSTLHLFIRTLFPAAGALRTRGMPVAVAVVSILLCFSR